MTDFPRLLRTLVEGRVDLILVGGAVATAHGSSRLTRDVDAAHEHGAQAK